MFNIYNNVCYVTSNEFNEILYIILNELLSPAIYKHNMQYTSFNGGNDISGMIAGITSLFKDRYDDISMRAIIDQVNSLNVTTNITLKVTSDIKCRFQAQTFKYIIESYYHNLPASLNIFIENKIHYGYLSHINHRQLSFTTGNNNEQHRMTFLVKSGYHTKAARCM
jgi:hypothetical protein